MHQVGLDKRSTGCPVPARPPLPRQAATQCLRRGVCCQRGKIAMFSRVYRCEDGHLFTADWGKLVVASSHFGRAKYLQCPVDHRPVMAMPIKGSRLTEEQISQASRYKF